MMPSTGGFPETDLSHEVTKLKVSFFILFRSSSLEEFILEEREVNMYEITKRGSKLPGYEDGRLPICNVNGGGNALEVAYMFNTSILH